MTTALDYTRDPEGNSDIIIPVGDIYNAFFANEILDIDHLQLVRHKQLNRQSTRRTVNVLILQLMKL